MINCNLKKLIMIYHKINSRKVDSDGDSNPMVAHERNESQTVMIDTDNAYSVFVTYVEIYNKNVYDLLSEDDVTSK